MGPPPYPNCDLCRIALVTGMAVVTGDCTEHSFDFQDKFPSGPSLLLKLGCPFKLQLRLNTSALNTHHEVPGGFLY